MKVGSFYGFKIDQFQTFDQKGKRLVVTKIKTAPLKITQIKTKDKDGYWAYQVAISKSLKSLKSLKGLKSLKKKKLREIKIDQKPEIKVGEEIKASDVFKVGNLVQVAGTTKGKGFTGVVKRWGFAGGPRTHGQSDRERAPGSIGQGTDPGRVWKGKKMAGHMGGKTKTIKGLKVFKIDEKNNELWITGLIPGGRGGLIKISKLT